MQRKLQLVYALFFIFLFCYFSEVFSDFIFSDIFGIIRLSVPLQGLFFSLTFLSLIEGCDYVEEVVISWEPAAIFWRTAPLTFQQFGIEPGWLDRFEPFETSLMRPTISHVVELIEFFGAFWD